MGFPEILTTLRVKNGMTQEALAEKLFMTRQAVSRWETGETMPGAETLLVLSRLFGVSVNTLLGAPRKLVCQSCGMPLEDDIMGHDANGTINEEYCKWCFDEGAYTSDCTMDEMIEVCIQNMPGSDPEAVRGYLRTLLPGLKRWQNK